MKIFNSSRVYSDTSILKKDFRLEHSWLTNHATL